MKYVRAISRATRTLALTLGLLAASTQAKATELGFWFSARDPGLEAALRVFEREHPGLRIITSAYIEGREARRLMTAIVGGDPPDVVMQDRYTVGEWAARGAFLPLDNWIAQSQHDEETGGADGIREREFYPACWQEAVYRGRVYGVPFRTDARALYYHEDMLRDAGFVDAEGNVVPPRTWDDLLRYTVALTLRDERRRITRLGFAPNFGNSYLFIYALANGGKFMDADSRVVLMNQKQVVEALQYMKKLYDAVGGVHETDAFLSVGRSGTELDPFGLGRLAMKIDGSWAMRDLAVYHPNVQYRIAPVPTPTGDNPVTWSGGFCYVIPAGAKHPDLAFELICFLVSERGWTIQQSVNARYAASRGRGYIADMTAQPAINARMLDQFVLSDPNVPHRAKQEVHKFQDLMKVSQFRPVSPVGQLMWDVQARAFENATRGDMDPQRALDEATATLQAALDEATAEHSDRTPVNWSMVATVTAALLTTALGLTAWVGRRRGAFRGYERGQVWAGLLFVAPWLTGFLILTAGPVVLSLVYSLCRYSVLSRAEWTGLDNYTRLLFHDGMFWHSLANTAYMLIGVPLGMAIGLSIAMLLNHEVRGMKVYRTLFYLPAIVPLVASSILWIWVLNPQNGLINSLLLMMGVDRPPLWLSSPSWGLGSKAAIMLMGLWGAGASMIIWLAGLKGIPQHLYEAAKIDGAGPVMRFRHVTIPMLTPYIFFNLVMGTIGTMQIFSQAFIMTEGGPADSTMFYALYLFNNAFRYMQMGYASAMAWLLLLIIMGLTALQMWSSKRWVHYTS